ncbi:MAG: hypothetical protein KO202_03990 [Methanobacteriaceae archaeon]|jgi:hypothetical protein|nr:hypothetical protein [Methanobacteriaceae archaeon]
MNDDRKKLIGVMNNLKADYKAGKISQDKFKYLYTKYNEKLKAMEYNAKKNSHKNTNYKNIKNSDENRLENEKLVKKYIVDPKRNAGEKVAVPSSNKGKFSFLLIFILIIAFSTGIAFGIFNFDFKDVSLTNAAAIVEDSAFPDIKMVNTTVIKNTSNTNQNSNSDTSNNNQVINQDSSGSSSIDSSSYNTDHGSSNGNSPSPTPEPSPEPTPEPSPEPNPSPE